MNDNKNGKGVITRMVQLGGVYQLFIKDRVDNSDYYVVAPIHQVMEFKLKNGDTIEYIPIIDDNYGLFVGKVASPLE